jgi:ADP-ribose pyrophosphatase YjhB (NUDIX family)
MSIHKDAFLVRVYGICIDAQERILLSDEYVFDQEMTKFPGGGLEYGEGTRACLARELLEETGLEFDVLDHFYTTDFFVASAFHSEKQLISVYYMVRPKTDSTINTSAKKNDFMGSGEREQSLRWVELRMLNPDDLTFPVDKFVVEMLLAKRRKNKDTS